MRMRVTGRSLIWLGLLFTATGHARGDFTSWQSVAINNPFQPTSGVFTNWTDGQHVFVFNPGTNSTVPFTIPTPTFDKFDPAAHTVNGKAGTLVGVELIMEYKFENTISLRFDNLSTLRVDVTGGMGLTLPTGAKVTADFPGTAAPTVPGNPTPNAGQFLNTSGDITLNPGNMLSKTVDLPKTTITGMIRSPMNTGFNDSATLAQFTGTSTVPLPVFARANSVFSSSSGNGFGSSTTLASVVVSIRYLFVVPEPASVVLTGLGMAAGLAWAGRSRSRALPRRAA